MNISLLGCGRWGSFIGWYLDKIGHNVTIWGLSDAPQFIEIRDTRKNNMLTFRESINVTDDLEKADSVSRKGELKEKIDAFRDGKYSILLGTQMVAKGLNFPNLKLVGIVLADTSLHLPDFRAAERTFSLITQVSGRAGRFFPDGEVVVQSYAPDLPPIDFAVKGKYGEFYKTELDQRKMLNFPPFTRLLRLVFRSGVPEAAEQASEGAAIILRENLEEGVDIMGPVECPIEMVAGNWRYHILLRGKSISAMQKMADILINGYTPPKHVHVEVDVDPVTIL